MMIVDDLIVSAVGTCPPAGKCQEVRAADEHLEPIVMEANAKPVTDQA